MGFNTFTYDVLDRLTGKTIAKSGSLASYNCELGPAGHISSVSELSGPSATFAYDAAYRLLNETISGDLSGRDGAVNYLSIQRGTGNGALLR
ncbi:MAG: hypothetical protein ABJF23_24595 [Bryobacteraceae bacterium]